MEGSETTRNWLSIGGKKSTRNVKYVNKDKIL